MNIEELERLLNDEGWYLQTVEISFTVGEYPLIRGLVRFPCREPVYFAVFLDSRVTAQSILADLKRHVE